MSAEEHPAVLAPILGIVLAWTLATCPLHAQRASRSWSPLNRVLLGAVALTTLGDWTQTIDLARRLDEGHREGGLGRIFLGSRPKLPAVHRTFALGTLAMVVIADRLPSASRNAWLAFVLGWQAAAVFVNRSHGLRFSLRF